MGDGKTPEERLGVLEAKLERLQADLKEWSTRTWAVFMSVFGLLILMAAKSLNWF